MIKIGKKKGRERKWREKNEWREQEKAIAHTACDTQMSV